VDYANCHLKTNNADTGVSSIWLGKAGFGVLLSGDEFSPTVFS
jgi:hypothetical protein